MSETFLFQIKPGKNEWMYYWSNAFFGARYLSTNRSGKTPLLGAQGEVQ